MKADRAPDIGDVASLILQAGPRGWVGSPPEWLIASLQQFHHNWSTHADPNLRKRLQNTHDAIRTLEKDIPMFLWLPLGMRQMDAMVIFGSLPGLKRDLEGALSGMRLPGRKRNMGE